MSRTSTSRLNSPAVYYRCDVPDDALGIYKPVAATDCAQRLRPLRVSVSVDQVPIGSMAAFETARSDRLRQRPLAVLHPLRHERDGTGGPTWR